MVPGSLALLCASLGLTALLLATLGAIGLVVSGRRLRAAEALGREAAEKGAELARLAERLARAEAEGRALLDAIPDVAWLKDPSGRYLAVNETFARACGRSRADVEGRHDGEVWPAEIAEKYRADDLLVLESRRPLRVDEPFQPALAEGPSWVEAIKTPVLAEDGSVAAIAGIARDVAARRELEKELSDARDFFHAVLNAIADPISVRSADHRYVLLNKAAGELLGYPVTAVLGKSPFDFFPGEQAEALVRLNREALEEGSQTTELELDGPGGWTRTFLVKATRHQPAAGTPLVVSVLADVTARRRLERRLAATTRFLDGVLNAIVDPVFVKDRDHRLVVVNDAFCALAGHPRERLLGRTDSGLFPPDQVAEFWRHDDLVFETGEEDTNEEALTGSGGAVRTVVTRKSLLEDVDGRPLVVGVIRDVTERKRQEEEVRQMNLQLAAANRELEAFATSASHDLQAPLRRIEGFCDALLEECDPCLAPDRRDLLVRIRRTAGLMHQLVDDLLALSYTARSEMERVPIDLGAMARQVAATLAEAEPERRVEVAVADGLRASADPRLLRQALENLLGNAFKFTRGRDPARIEVGRLDGDGPAGAFFVRDNGIGFDPSRAERLFTVFQRLHPQDEFPGTGVGLAIVQRIVHRHGGLVGAEAAAGKGATFWFTLS